MPAWLSAETAHGEVTCLAFVADPQSSLIDTGIPWNEKVQFTVTGSGFLGTSFDYVAKIAEHFRVLRIRDAEVEALYRDACAALADLKNSDRDSE